MSSAAWSTIGAVISALVVLAGGVYTQRQTSRIDRTKVDGQAYERARSFDRETTDRIRVELDRAQQEIEQLRATLSRERVEHGQDRAAMSRQIDALERTVFRLRRQLRSAGIDIDSEEEAAQ